MTSLRETLKTASQALKDAQIAHALIGGFALGEYGVHRATSDIDLLADGDKLALIKSTLLAAGFSILSESVEVLHFGGRGFLDVLLARRPISQTMLRDARPNGLLGLPILGAEDIIGLKIQAYMNDPKRILKDQADIQALIEKNDDLDWKKIKAYADSFQQWSVIENIRGRAK